MREVLFPVSENLVHPHVHAEDQYVVTSPNPLAARALDARGPTGHHFKIVLSATTHASEANQIARLEERNGY